MKNLFNSTYRILIFYFIFFVIILANINLFAAEPDRVAIIPFKVNAQKDHTFLQNGIYDMLSSRLVRADKVQIIGREETAKAFKAVTGPVNEISARKTGKKLNADFILFGSLTIFGNSISIDVKMADVSGSKPTLTFFDHTQGMDEVVGRINMIASDINEKVFGIKAAVVAPPPTSSTPAPESQKRDLYAHPESLLRRSSARKNSAGAESSPFIMHQKRSEKPMFHKSPNFKMKIYSLALGDVDGDGKIETVTLSNRKVLILRNENGHFSKIKETFAKNYQKFVSVDVADIKKDGVCEIFVTCVNTIDGSLDSFVLEFDGTDFKTIAKGEKWYFRAHKIPDKHPVLWGQKRGLLDLFLPGIHKLIWSNGSYESAGKVSLPNETNIFGFATGDVLNEGSKTIATFDEDDRLSIFSPDGEKLWKSDERYGGSKNFLLKTPNSSEDLIFLPQRIFITDFDQDGKYEVTVVKNHSTSGYLFRRSIVYSGAQIVSLFWDGLGLNLNWNTRKVSGYSSDFAIGDIDNDGKPEIATTMVSNLRSHFKSKAKSSIITYDLDELHAKKSH